MSKNSKKSMVVGEEGELEKESDKAVRKGKGHESVGVALQALTSARSFWC